MATIALYGMTPEMAQYVAFEVVLCVASMADVRTRVIPNACVAIAAAIRVCYCGALAAMGLLSASSIVLYVASGVGMYLLMLLFTLGFERATGRQGMGGGDLKLYGLCGLYFGFEAGLGIVFLSCIMALGASALSFQDESRRPAWARKGEAIRLSHTLPFGPAIALSCVVVILAIAPSL